MSRPAFLHAVKRNFSSYFLRKKTSCSDLCSLAVKDARFWQRRLFPHSSTCWRKFLISFCATCVIKKKMHPRPCRQKIEKVDSAPFSSSFSSHPSYLSRNAFFFARCVLLIQTDITLWQTFAYRREFRFPIELFTRVACVENCHQRQLSSKDRRFPNENFPSFFFLFLPYLPSPCWWIVVLGPKLLLLLFLSLHAQMPTGGEEGEGRGKKALQAEMKINRPPLCPSSARPPWWWRWSRTNLVTASTGCTTVV